MVRAVLFDVVGTLLHLREPVGRTYARLARDFGVDRAEASLQQAFVRAFAQMPPMAFPGLTPAEAAGRERGWWRDLVERTFRETGGNGAAELTSAATPIGAAQAAHGGNPGNAWFADFDSFFAQLFEHFAGPEVWTCAPGASEVLAGLRVRGIRTGVVSNFDQRLPALLDTFGLLPLLDVVVLPADAGATKPDPRIFALALDRLGLPAGKVVYVGDDEVEDVRAAEALGMRAIDVTRLDKLSDLLERVGGERVQ